MNNHASASAHGASGPDTPGFDAVRALYQDVILDRSRNPRHQHRLDPCDAQASGNNPLCGDQVEVRVVYAADGTLAETAFEARGCAISVASADLMAEAVRGRAAGEVRALARAFEVLVGTGCSDSDDRAIEALRPLSGVHAYRSRVKCATLPWHALLAALDGTKEAKGD